jgi:S1-C subfamily serine protease
MEDLLVQLKQADPGQTITLTVLRDGKNLDLQVTLGERPASQ